MLTARLRGKREKGRESLCKVFGRKYGVGSLNEKFER